MDIAIRRIYLEIDLSEYFGEPGGEDIRVWVNPPNKLLNEWEEIRGLSTKTVTRISELAKLKAKERGPKLEAEREKLARELKEANDRFYAWFAQIWKFEGEHPAAEEVGEFARRCEDQDPTLWAWLAKRTWDLINEHRSQTKKGFKRSS